MLWESLALYHTVKIYKYYLRYNFVSFEKVPTSLGGYQPKPFYKQITQTVRFLFICMHEPVIGILLGIIQNVNFCHLVRAMLWTQIEYYQIFQPQFLINKYLSFWWIGSSLKLQSNLVIRNFLVTAKLFLKVKCSLLPIVHY